YGVTQSSPCGKWHSSVNSSPQLSSAMRALENSEIRPRSHVVDGCHAASIRVSHRRIEGAIEHRRIRIRNNPIDQLLRVVLEDAARLSGCVTGDSAACYVATRHRHSGGAHRGRVGERHVAIETVDPDGIVWRD